MNSTRDMEEQWDSMTSILKLNFRSTSCIGQSFPCFNNHTCKENLLWELQELILTYLPALKLLELKAVCRSWRDLLQSPKFKEKWQLMRGGCGTEMVDVWVMKSEQEDLIAYIPALDKYFLFLSLICSSLVMTQPSFAFKLKEVSFLCAWGPWILLGNKDWRSGPSFFVYDSKTCSRIHVRELPLQIGGHDELYFISPSSFPVLIQDKDQPHFCIAIETESVSENRSHPFYQLCIYKSSMGIWTSYPQSSAVQADFSDMSAVLGGDFFQYDQDDSTLYAWSMQHWSKVRISFSDGTWPAHDMIHNTDTNAFKVVKCEGDILLITSTVQQEGGVVAQGFTIWKLLKGGEEPVTWNWFEISRTPPELRLKSFNQESLLHPTSMCDGCRICIVLSSQEYFPPLVYDVKHGSWCHLHGVWKDMQALFAMKLSLKIDGI